MKKRFTAILLCVVLAFSLLSTEIFAAQNTEDIVILYENDVHCAVDGYAKFSALKKELQQEYAHVGAVSGGDFIHGNSLGAVSQGEYIIHLMNLVGYDAVTLGNHEFDYRLPRLNYLVSLMDTKPICCNFNETGKDDPYFQPYSMVSYGDVEIAYIGITTPSTLTMSNPMQFKDENGELLYTFHHTDLYEVVQANIDAAKAAGADYIIALSHVGYADDAVYGDLEDVENLIQNTDGFDVVLDAHSHTVIEGKTMTDKGGNEVLLTSTGTQFEYIGKLTISDGTFRSELIKTADYQNADPAVVAYIEQINAEYAVLGERKVAYSEVDLITKDAEGNRLVRRAETNLGDLCAEAFRSTFNANIGYINGGGIRSDIAAGDITFNNLLSVFPFNNTIVMAEADGQTIKDMMEMAMMLWPSENGSFPHLAGITFSVNADIPTSVVLNEQEEFVGVNGAYRVYDIKIRNTETGEYEPLELDRTYTIVSHNFALIEHGSGMKMLENVKILQNDGLLDVEVLERYITESLNGRVGEQYREATPNITFTTAADEEDCLFQDFTDLDPDAWYHDAVEHVLSNGMMNGVGNGKFDPHGMSSRAMIVTLLWRLEGQPLVEIAEGFNDVYANAWYHDAIRWATNNGIVEGYEGYFYPDAAVTREQAATILYRYAVHKDYDVSVGEDTNILSYNDAFDVSDWAMEAIQWAVGSGLLEGDGANLTPAANATRCQSAALLTRFCQEIAVH